MEYRLVLGGASTQLRDPGWGKTLSALQFVHREPLSDDLWREPITGAIMLRPGPFCREWREDSVYESDKLTAEHFHRRPEFWETIYVREGILDPFVTLIYPADLSPTDVELDLGVPLTGLSDRGMVWALHSKQNLTLNQGVYLELRHFGFSYERDTEYMALGFGQYALKLQTGGTAELFRYVVGDMRWDMLYRMRFAGASEQHGEGLSLLILPVLGNRLHFYFSSLRSVDPNSNSERIPSLRPSYHAYRLPRSDERWDESVRVWRVTNEGPLRIAVSPARRYFMQVAKVRFPTGWKSVYLGGDDIGFPCARPPYLVLHGTLPGNASMQGLVLDETTGGVFVVGESTRPQARIRLRGATTGPWSPELHAVSLDIPPRRATVSRPEARTNRDVLRLSVRLHLHHEPQTLDVLLRDPEGTYTQLLRHTNLPCQLSLASHTVFRGQLVRSESHDGRPERTVRLHAEDGWQRLERTGIAPSISFDGMLHTEVVRYLLTRAGFADSEIQLEYGEGTLPGGGQRDDAPDTIPLSPAANDWRFGAKVNDTSADLVRLLTSKFSGWALRHDGGVWRYFALDDTAEPAVYLFLSSSAYSASQLPNENKVRAFRYRYHVLPPAFNCLYVYGSDGPREARRLMTYERNLPSIEDPDSPDFVGQAVEMHTTASWASTIEACARTSRLMMRESGRSRRYCFFVCEWKPALTPGAVIAVMRDAAATEGIFRLLEVEIELNAVFGAMPIARCAAELIRTE